MSYREVSSSYPKGRKEYRCGWCNEKILIGEKHYQRAYVFNGDFQDDRMHLECEEAMDNTDHYELSEGWVPGDYSRPKNPQPKRSE